MPRRHWLFKSEPFAFSWDDLKKKPKRTECWDGVRNYQARNLLRDEIKKGDGVLFYHSRVIPQVIMGTAKVVKEGYPDHTQFDPKGKYFDPKSDPEKPRWFMVDIKADRDFKQPVTRDVLKEIKAVEDMVLLQKGSRLSVQPVGLKHWKTILKLGGLSFDG